MFFSPAIAQQQQRPLPHIGYLYPAGAKQGSTVVISVGGQNLLGAKDAFFTGGGIQAKVLHYERPLTQKEINDLREKQQQLTEKRAAARGTAKADQAAQPRPVFSDEDEKTLAEIRQKLALRPSRLANAGLAETVTLELTVAADASPGERELRLKTAPAPNTGGLSNPFAFHVGQLPEFAEPVVTGTMNAPTRNRREFDPRSGRSKPTAMDVALPSVVNGQILPGEVDRFRFAAQKGQRLTVVVSARSLIPFLADAVPGWFQATVALYDDKGRELAYEDDFRFNPDPVLAYAIPADGNYTIEIKDSIYRGREDFVYRIAVGELPFVTSIFPLGCSFPERATFDLNGWNLPATKLAVETKDKRPGTFLVAVKKEGQLSNHVRFALDAQPEAREAEPNDEPASAQLLQPPVIVNGRVERPGDDDVFRFEGKAGALVVAEVFARRLNSPLDSVLSLRDASGGELAANDDHEDKASGLTTHHADSRVAFTLPADATYFVRVADAQHRGGSDFGYRLRVGPPRPDFDLRVTPATINARAGAHTPITVYALRRDGFSGDIMLSLRDAPRGFTLSGARIPAGQDKVQLTLFAPVPTPESNLRTPKGKNKAPPATYAPIAALEDPVELMLIGMANIDGRNVVHPAVPAEDMMQAFAYRHLVPAQRLIANVVGRAGSCRIVSGAPVRLRVGATARLELTNTSVRDITKVNVELIDAPEGITVQRATVRGETIEVLLACDPTKARPGLRGNLILVLNGERAAAAKAAPAARIQRVPLGSVPAIPFEIIGRDSTSTD